MLIPTLCWFRFLGLAGRRDAGEDQQGPIQPHHNLIRKAADRCIHLCLRNGSVLSTINRQTARRPLLSAVSDDNARNLHFLHNFLGL